MRSKREYISPRREGVTHSRELYRLPRIARNETRQFFRGEEMEIADLQKELLKFSKEVLVYYILRHYYSQDTDDMLRDMRFKTWEIKSEESLKQTKKENAATSRLAEKLKKLPCRTDVERLKYLREKAKLFEMFRKNLEKQNKRDEELDKLYNEIG